MIWYITYCNVFQCRIWRQTFDTAYACLIEANKLVLLLDAYIVCEQAINVPL